MSFTPIIPTNGLSGWRIFQSTAGRQTEAFEKSAPVLRAASYFAENIKDIKSAKDLVADRRALEVALGAFGLKDDIDNKYFIERILAEGTYAEGALANRLSDTRYHDLAKAFSFDTLPRTGRPGFAEEIIEQYNRREFEIAVGNENQAFRFSLNTERALPELAKQEISNDAKWYTVLGNPALREVFERALGLPSEMGQLDIEKQLETFKDRAYKRFGTDEISHFKEPEQLDKLIQTYLLQDQIFAGVSSNSSELALTLLLS